LNNFKLADNKLSFGIDDARIRFEIERVGNQLNGSWTRKGKSVSKLSFSAQLEPLPLPPTSRSASDFVGEWHCAAKEDDGKETPILLIITAKGDNIEGTGIDPTGDFGQMRGQLINDKLALSRFDGQSLSLVVVSLTGDQLRAAVSTSPSSQFEITGARKGASLPDPGSVAKVNNGLSFEFPDPQGKNVSFPGAQFQGKVVVIDVMGTWCHNCHDETPFLIELYHKYHDRGLEIISLCFEAQETEAEDRHSIAQYQQSRNIPYPMLYGGKIEGGGPAKHITGMENFAGYPTNIFIGRDGHIAATHTGFWGPATGEKYLACKREFEETIQHLLEK
jgi:thiol-disulfide isomerase/thioredoxin